MWRGAPLPIPNREVKPAYTDGTAMKCGRVGSANQRQYLITNRFQIYEEVFLLDGVFLDEEGSKKVKRLCS